MKVVLGRDDLADAAEKAVKESGEQFERLAIRPVHKASRGFVDGDGPDVCELAIVTLLQAVAQGRPVLLLPVTALGRDQHQTLVTMGRLTVDDLEGRSVGVRAWSQTTGVWVRGFLTEQYGVDLRRIDWRTYEGAHVDGYEDPSWVTRAPEGSKLPADFLDGRVDFGIMGNELPADDRIRTAIADARTVAAEWAASTGFTPVNHVLGMTETAAREHAPAILAAFDAMRAAAAASPTAAIDPAGFTGLRAPFTRAAAYALEQEVIPRAVEFDEIVDRTCAALGVPASRLGG
jgi:4,5-dihydroxyphthalate decarboxylase